MGLLSLPGTATVTSAPPLSKGIITGGAPSVSWIEAFPAYFINGTNIGQTSQRVQFTFWQAPVTGTVTKLRTVTGGTAAAATPTVGRVGLYTVPDTWTGNLDCVAAIANDTTLWATTFTVYDRALAAATVGGQAMPLSYQVVAGKYYATATLQVNAGTPASFYGSQNVMDGLSGGTPAINTIAPRLGAALNGQSDLPLSVVISSLATNGAALYSMAGL